MKKDYNNLKNTIVGRKVFLAASTHPGEEMIISNLTQKIRSTNREFLCVLVPRHPNRSDLTKEILDCKFATRSKNESINDDTDIYLADTFGELGLFYKLADIAFIGGSLVPHGGQNPIEAAHFCNNIFHGKYIENFLEVYETLNHLHITELVDNPRQLQLKIMRCYNEFTCK
jgi:3-deoxy-D-manno-octulosonic-acid transferase